MIPEMIFSDIDGTLITEDLVISPRTQTAIRAQAARGTLFIPVSARMPAAIKPIVDVLGISYPIISYNGALVQDHLGKTVASKTLSGAVAATICQYLEQNWSDVAWNVYTFEKWYSEDRRNYWIHREEEVVNLQSSQIKAEQVNQIDQVHKLLLMGEPEIMDHLEPRLKEVFPELSIAKSLPYYIEVMAQGIEKGQAVRDLVAYYQKDFNDVAMLKTVKEGYVMGNAPLGVKEQFEHLTADHNHDGIALVLEELM